jgi:hypothetical protein
MDSDSSGVRAILVILFTVVVLANLVALIGYPMLIVTAVIAAFVALAFIVALSAGDMIDRPARPERYSAALAATA